jgi:hypothetical protein
MHPNIITQQKPQSTAKAQNIARVRDITTSQRAKAKAKAKATNTGHGSHSPLLLQSSYHASQWMRGLGIFNMKEEKARARVKKRDTARLRAKERVKASEREKASVRARGEAHPCLVLRQFLQRHFHRQFLQRKIRQILVNTSATIVPRHGHLATMRPPVSFTPGLQAFQRDSRQDSRHTVLQGLGMISLTIVPSHRQIASICRTVRFPVLLVAMTEVHQAFKRDQTVPTI